MKIEKRLLANNGAKDVNELFMDVYQEEEK